MPDATAATSSKEDVAANAKQAEKEAALAKAEAEAAEISRKEARNDNIRLAVLVLLISFLFFNYRRWNAAIARINEMERTIQHMDKLLGEFLSPHK